MPIIRKVLEVGNSKAVTIPKRARVNICWQLQLLDGTRYDAVCIDCGGKVPDLIREFEVREQSG